MKLYRFTMSEEQHDILAKDLDHAVHQYKKFADDNEWPELDDLKIIQVLSDEVH